MSAAIPLALVASSAISGYLNNRKQTNTSTSTTNLPPELGGLQNVVLSSLQNRLASPTPLAGYQAQGIQGINHTFDLLKQSQENNLTARGLAGSPIAAQVDATRDTARGGGIAAFNNSLPLVQRDMQTQDLGLAQNLLNAGRGVSSSRTDGGNLAGGTAGSMNNMLAFLFATGAFGGGAGKTTLPSQQLAPYMGMMPMGGTSGSGMGGYY